MHDNDEGKLFDAVFHKLLALGVTVIAVAALVWMVWAVARMSAITSEGSETNAPAGAGSSKWDGPGGAGPLAHARVRAPGGEVGLFIRPAAWMAARVTERLDRFPSALADAAADAAFFAGGPS